MGEGPDPQDIAEMDRMIAARLLPGAETMDKELRYETKIHRFMLQKIHQLLVLQAIRKGSGATPPSSLRVRSARIRKLRVTETRSAALVGLANTAHPEPVEACPEPGDSRSRRGPRSNRLSLSKSLPEADEHEHDENNVGAQLGVKSGGGASSTALLDSAGAAATHRAAPVEGDWDAEAEEEAEPARSPLVLRDAVGHRPNRAQRRRKRRARKRQC
jgi:hypothetical protein